MIEKINSFLEKKLIKGNNRKTTLILVCVCLAGVLVFAYPSIADYWNSFHQSRAIMSYATEVADMNSEEYADWISHAKEYNQKLAQNGMNWLMTDAEKSAYEKELDVSGNGIMGYITIDKIDVMLPIYHGIQESVLQTSIGHLAETSLPVGAASYDSKEDVLTDPQDGSHCALSGHRGLPSAKLFSDLDKLVEGDIFSLHVLNETFSYQVDQIRIVEPTDLSELQIVPGKDYCTLVTCTPYGVNTHRLLVRGHRVASPNGDSNVLADAIQIKSIYVAPFIAAAILIFLIVVLWICSRHKTHWKNVYECIKHIWKF